MRLIDYVILIIAMVFGAIVGYTYSQAYGPMGLALSLPTALLVGFGASRAMEMI